MHATSLSIHMLMNIGCFHILSILNNAAINNGVYLFEFMFLFSLDIHPVVKMLDNVIVLFS